MIESMKNKFKDIFDIFLKYPYDGVMFHCSAGKDRTGMTAALLLDLIGCHEYDIVKDYSESYENNMEINEELSKMMDNEEAKQNYHDEKQREERPWLYDGTPQNHYRGKWC